MYKHILISILFFLIGTQAFSSTPDNAMWNAFRLRKNVNEKIQTEFWVEQRIKNNIREVDKNSAEFGLKYNILNKVDLNTAYRLIIQNENMNYNTYHRFVVDAILKEEVSLAAFDLRLRYQTKVDDIITTTEKNKRNYLRSGLKLKFNLFQKHIEPYAWAESFMRLANEPAPFKKMRYTLGTYIFPVPDKLYFELYYRYDQSLTNLPNIDTNIFGATVYLKL